MYRLYIANKNYSSWSLRPWLLMTELAINFTEVMNPFEEHSSWTKFREFSPSGLVPCLSHNKDADDSVNDLHIWDSLAIIEYLAERHPTVWPEDVAARAWSRSASAEMHSGFSALRNQCPMNCGLIVELHEKTEGLLNDIARIEELWLQGLTQFGGPFLAGDKFTAVDAFYAPVVFRFQSFGITVNDAATKYIKHMLATKSMQSWYQSALTEEWREVAHEEEIAESGTIKEDLRNSNN